MRAKSGEPLALALSAGPVAGGQRSGLIEKEQFSILARRHDSTPPSLELQQTDDPAPDLVGAHDTLARVVEAAAVAHEGAACGRGDQRPLGRDAILVGHGRFSSPLTALSSTAGSSASSSAPWQGAHTGGECWGERWGRMRFALTLRISSMIAVGAYRIRH